MLDTSHTPSKVHSHRSPSPTVSSARSPEGPQRRSAQEVREFMGQKERERRRRERQKKEEVQREEERRKARVQEVLHKQRTALNRAKRRPQNLVQVDRAVGVTDLGRRAEMSRSGRGRKTPERAWQGRGVMFQFSSRGQRASLCEAAVSAVVMLNYYVTVHIMGIK
ncbi:hypothetical protein AAFF_G00010100 [Aldrovandia affinis]|uniref:Uncharacterized protein n=1 Tax=Aldrovandia affinis TaxID=143900 RepID=A0AAD7S720_9TELE|nr:hypothetical protein AAFF_G00010100 [Aldrovandia affinis]